MLHKPMYVEITARNKVAEEIEKIEKYFELSSPSSRVGFNPASPKELFEKIY